MNVSKFSLISKLVCNVLSEDPFMYFIEEVSLGKEDWNCFSCFQPLTNIIDKKCKRCGFYEHDAVLSDDVFEEWEFCASDFTRSDGKYVRYKDKEFNATFLCLECVPLGKGKYLFLVPVFFFFFHFLRSIDLHHVAAFLNLFAIKVLIKCVIEIITNHDLARKACGAEVH